MGILDRLKQTRQDDEDEDSQDGDEESDDAVPGKGGLRGRLGALRGIGGNAAGMLGKVLKRGGGDDDDDDDEVDGGVVAVPAPVVTTGSPGKSIGKSIGKSMVVASSAEPPDEDNVIPPVGATPVAGAPDKAPKASGKFEMGDLFSEEMEVNLVLRDLAMSQDAVTARQLADDLEVLLGRLTIISNDFVVHLPRATLAS